MKSSLQCPYCYAKTSSLTLTSIQNVLQADIAYFPLNQREITAPTRAFPWAGGGGCWGSVPPCLPRPHPCSPGAEMGIWLSRGWRPRAEPSLRGDLLFWWLERPKDLWASVQPSPPLSPGMSGMPAGPQCLEPQGAGVIILIGSFQCTVLPH